MPVVNDPAHPVHVEPGRDERRWAWRTVAIFAVVLVVSNLAYGPVLRARGQHEGDLLAMTRDVPGVAWEVGFALALAAAPVAGVVLATRALRRRATRSTWIALVANSVLVLVVVYQFVDAIRMSFFAPLD